MQRSYLLDVLKGIAIIFVILFHAGIFTYGYLGVEIFLVIAGYLTTRSILRAYERDGFEYWRFILNRLVRLWPLLVIISLVALVLGYFCMLPDSYKNTSETSLGTLLFLNNFVQYITAGDYWDVSNDYKPLMHTWYVGILFQFYLVYPWVLMVTHRCSRDWKRLSVIVLLAMGILSLAFYLIPQVSGSFHFYMLPSRLFEFAFGGIIALLPSNISSRWKENQKIAVGLMLILLILLFGINIEHSKLLVFMTVAVTAWILYVHVQSEQTLEQWNVKLIIRLGVASYSLYLWHQVIFAFYRYAINYNLSVWEYVLLIGGSLVAGYLSYLLIELPLGRIVKRTGRGQTVILIVCLIFVTLLGYTSLRLYFHHGVVRNVPELGIYKDNPTSWEPQEYNDAVNRCNIDFPNNGKKNVLVVGDSYGRDWYNILHEAQIDRSANLSYCDAGDSILRKRIVHADLVFLATHGDFSKFENYLPQMMSKSFYRVGDKKFFSTAGVIYNHGRGLYYQQGIPIPNEIIQYNKEQQCVFGDRFIDIMNVIKKSDGTCRVFTPDSMLISHDGLHLTKAGAKYFAKHLNITHFLSKCQYAQ